MAGKMKSNEYVKMNPPSNGVIICIIETRELFTPNNVPVCSCSTVFESFDVRIGLETPVP